MANHVGLQRVVKTVRGKNGSVHRAYWVHSGTQQAHAGVGAKPAGPGFIQRHQKGLIAGATALSVAIGLVGAAHAANHVTTKYAPEILGAHRGYKSSQTAWAHPDWQRNHPGTGRVDAFKMGVKGAVSGARRAANRRRD